MNAYPNQDGLIRRRKLKNIYSIETLEIRST